MKLLIFFLLSIFYSSNTNENPEKRPFKRFFGNLRKEFPNGYKSGRLNTPQQNSTKQKDQKNSEKDIIKIK